MKFQKLTIDKKWQQFSDINIEFHPRLTIITGANGSGKTTLVKNILAKHDNWNSVSMATPVKNSIKKVFEWVNSFREANVGQQQLIGKLVYSSGNEARLLLPQGQSATYSISIENQLSVKLMFIPSHRSLFRYQKITNIPTNITTRDQAYNQVSSLYKRRSNDGYEENSTSFLMKQTLLAWNLFGHSNDQREGSEQYLELYAGFEKILKKLLPEELGFNNFKIRDFEVVMECESGDFLIDASSGGISAILDLAWQVYMFTTKDAEESTVVIDEIENHLHPKLQRQILPALVEAFPDASFVVTTHSPLVVGSVKDSAVFALTYQDSQVKSIKLDLSNKAKTASEILDEVLGVSFTMPVWAEKELGRIVEEYKQKNLEDEVVLESLRSEMDASGLNGFVPRALNKLFKEYEKAE